MAATGPSCFQLALLVLWWCGPLLPRVQADQFGNPNATDSGGDSCSYYEVHPHHCGCCDSQEFISSECFACQDVPYVSEDDSTWWTWVFHTWPRKARTLSLPWKSIQSNLPEDIAERWPFLTRIDLQENYITGELPRQLWDLSSLVYINMAHNQLRGNLPSELGNLKSLEFLDLSYNQLSGRIPAEIGDLRNMEYLDLSNNQLSSSIPHELGNLRKLEHLDLSDHQLSGSIPHELGNLNNLEYLDLGNNQLSSIPRELGNLTNLQDLILTYNHIHGSIPAEFGNLRRLERLYLDRNEFNGSLPCELGNLSSLTVLELDTNVLSGNLPHELGRLTNLQQLWLSNNQFTGNLPLELGNLWNLVVLVLQYNSLSGGLPPELGNLASLEILYLQNNQLIGGFPPELGNLSRLRWLDLQENQLNGSLVPELGNLRSLEWLYLSGNRLTGSIPPELGSMWNLINLAMDRNHLSGSLPPELGNLGSLQLLNLNENQLTGSLPPEIGNLVNLDKCRLNNNLLSGSLPPEIFNRWGRELDLSSNQFSGHLPPGIGNARFLSVLRLNDNQLGGDLPPELGDLAWLEELRLDNNQFHGNLPPELGNLRDLRMLRLDDNRFNGSLPWELMKLTSLSSLNLSANQLSGNIPAWLGELKSLLNVSLASNLFGGDLPLELGNLQKVSRLNISGNQLSGSLTAELFSSWGTPEELDLSRNHITAVLDPPPAGLKAAFLSRNALTTLHEGWWSRGTDSGPPLTVDVRDNPDLRLSVVFAGDEVCPAAGVQRLIANFHHRTKEAGIKSECASLCPLRNGELLVDHTVNSSVLCRCQEGQGVGLECSDCTGNTYSALVQESEHFKRECRECPENSLLPGPGVKCFAGCHCSAGYFMAQMNNGTAQGVGTIPCERLERAEGGCEPCGVFKTSRPGSRKRAECFCNSNVSNGGWDQLLERDGQCGCARGFHMSFAERSCVKCRIEEDCGDWERSLEPPRIKAGFWATLPPPRGGDGTFGNFSRHSIWRCRSASACPGGFAACGWNLTGTACSLCQRGHFTTFSGPCTPCPLSYTDTRRLLAMFILACTLFPALALLQLKSDKGESQALASNMLAFAFRPVRTSIKQLLKFMQILGLLALFNVEWPPMTKYVLGYTQIFSPDIAAFVGVACLDSRQQQSMTLELAFRWMLPLAGVAITCLAALLIMVGGRCLVPLCIRCRPGSEARIQQLSSLQLLDVLRVLLFFFQLFFPSLLRNALIPLTCSPSPHGELTLNLFPQVSCLDLGAENGFWQVAVMGLAQSVLLSFGFPLLLFFAWKRVCASRTSIVLRQRRRWWAFLFADFRLHRRSWALVAVCKDIVLNLVVVLLPGLGTAQLLAAAMVSMAYACRALWTSPYPDISNSLLETWLSAAIASQCLFSAGMGFQSESDIPDLGGYVAEGREGAGYLRRAVTLLCLQGLSLLAPAAILTFQLLVAFPWTRSCVPACLQPLGEERRGEWSQHFTKAMGLDGGPLPRALQDFDDIEFSTFQHVVLEATEVQKALASMEGCDEERNLAKLVPSLRADLVALHAKMATLESNEASAREREKELWMEIEQLRAKVGLAPSQNGPGLTVPDPDNPAPVTACTPVSWISTDHRTTVL